MYYVSYPKLRHKNKLSVEPSPVYCRGGMANMLMLILNVRNEDLLFQLISTFAYVILE